MILISGGRKCLSTAARSFAAGLFAIIAVSTSAVFADTPFEGTIARSAKDSAPVWTLPATAPEGAPNIVVILIDDIGFADTATFGGIPDTPAIDRIASEGLVYNNFNVTAMCSPTRAALLTGHNHHRVGFGVITEGANGYPGYDMMWKDSTASVAKVLGRNGYSTAAIGKWHNTPVWEITPDGPFDRWPTGLGFDYFYGFMGAEDNHWEPARLYRGTTLIEAPHVAGEEYHLTTDLADQAIGWLDQQRSVASDKPYFLYFATGAVHTPHHAPEDWIARYRGRFDAGWDVLRQEIFARQKRMGVIPENAILTPRPPAIPAWDSLSADDQRLFARQMEVYAAFVAHTDYQLGRLLQAIRSSPEADNTLIFTIVGDNGAKGTMLQNYGGTSLADELTVIDKLGSAKVPFNQYASGWGWMGNTPFQYWKTIASHFGGLRAPMIVNWPKEITAAGALREQFTHVTDIAPTIYELTGISKPENMDGVDQHPLDGFSIAATFDDAEARTGRETQYFELGGNRALYHDGWMASALNAYYSPSNRSDDWELYHVSEDFSQGRNIVADHPEKLAELQALFDQEAWANNVYPLGGAAYNPVGHPFAWQGKTRFVFYQGEAMIPEAVLPNLNRKYSIEAEILVPDTSAHGVLFQYGSRTKGFVWYLEEGRLVYENRTGLAVDRIVSDQPLPVGAATLRYSFDCETCEGPGRSRETLAGTGRLYVNGELVAEQRLDKVNLVNGGEGLPAYLGRAGGSRVSDSFDAPNAFTGRIERLTVTID